MQEKLNYLIIKEKKVSFTDLMNQHFNLPVDRVSRILFMLEHEISFGMSNELKDFFLSKVKYAMKKWQESCIMSQTRMQLQWTYRILRRKSTPKLN